MCRRTPSSEETQQRKLVNVDRMILSISAPNICINEIRFIVAYIFKERLSLRYELSFEDRSTFLLIDKERNKRLELDASFFHAAGHEWLQKLEPSQLKYHDNEWLLSDKNQRAISIPILFGDAQKSIDNESINIHFDIIGSIFYVLTQYDEATLSEYDKFNRISIDKTFLHKNSLYKLPIVDVYVSYLHFLLSEMNITSQHTVSFPKISLSCDVDHIYDTSAQSSSQTIKRILARIFRDKNYPSAFNCFLNRITNKKDHRYDEYYKALSYIANIASDDLEKHFNFIVLKTSNMDNVVDEELVKHTIKKFKDKVDVIGAHLGFETFNNESKAKQSIAKFEEILDYVNAPVSCIYNRQHYLRYCVLQTPRILEASGIHIDTSVGYAENVGFRSGTCHQYPMYDLRNRKSLKIRQQPLIAMDHALINESRDEIELLQNMNRYYNLCLRYDGTFTILWHNSTIARPYFLRTLKHFIQNR